MKCLKRIGEPEFLFKFKENKSIWFFGRDLSSSHKILHQLSSCGLERWSWVLMHSSSVSP